MAKEHRRWGSACDSSGGCAASCGGWVRRGWCTAIVAGLGLPAPAGADPPAGATQDPVLQPPELCLLCGAPHSRHSFGHGWFLTDERWRKPPETCWLASSQGVVRLLPVALRTGALEQPHLPAMRRRGCARPIPAALAGVPSPGPPLPADPRQTRHPRWHRCPARGAGNGATERLAPPITAANLLQDGRSPPG
jgi:hypothetical protein